MSSPQLNPKSDVNELWFPKFFIGSMIAIACLTILLSLLPSGIRNTPSVKTSLQTQSTTNLSI
ncbi:hypothetical protein [Pseudanabaena sp. 'Roaring Creek']|uniref:hypothetical protein n=1 Tax=Pseudanabaena sp. 'Roaring Creek' TaxID=1681830 RepID=UPI0006D7A1C2|nr:hypothetical protein [Pseudanabaena sp. 'Roaring Creek']